MNHTVDPQKPLSNLFSDLASETGTLIRNEAELVKLEMGKKVSLVGREVWSIFLGSLVMVIGAGAIAAAMILALAMIIPAWLAAALVGIAITAVGFTTAMKGVTALKGLDPAPRETIQTMKDNVKWVERQMSQ